MTSSESEELERLRIELAEARARAEEASAAKRTFLLNMSHELRTPLNVIIGYSDMLVEEAIDLGEQGEYLVEDLKKIGGAGKSLLTLVEDLLDMSRIASGDREVFYEEVNVRQLLSEVEYSVREIVEKGGNRLAINFDPAVYSVVTDRTKLRQVLREMLHNAATFTSEGHIDVTVKLVADGQEDHLSVAVRDDGPGIADEDLERIFDAFHQVDSSTTREHDGSGVGLALCREFCRMLRGDLTVTSTPGAGSEFTVTLPVAGPATRIEEITAMDVLDLWANVEPDIRAAASLEEAAQTLATALHTRLADSAVLARVFVSAELASLPDVYESFAKERVERGPDPAPSLQGSTPVLSLIGSCGVDPGWNDARRSKDHLATPLISADFVAEIPMIASLLKDVGLPLDWMERGSDVVQRTIGHGIGLFFVENAALVTDEKGRKVIPAQDFVNHHGVGSVFGLSGAYPGDEILVVIVFCNEVFPKATAERFLPLLTHFKSATEPLVSAGRIFAAETP